MRDMFLSNDNSFQSIHVTDLQCLMSRSAKAGNRKTVTCIILQHGSLTLVTDVTILLLL